MAKGLLKNYSLLVNLIVKSVEKAGMNNSQNNEKGAMNKYLIQKSNLGVFPNYYKDLS